jgi:hypothetical protein
MPDPPPPSRSPTLTHAGSSYSLGGGKDFYAIWERGRTNRPPAWVFPRTQGGWESAWRQFSSLEPKPSKAVNLKRSWFGRGDGRAQP